MRKTIFLTKENLEKRWEEKSQNHCAAAVLKDFSGEKISSKKVLTKGLVFAIIINVVARTANTEKHDNDDP